MDNLQTDAGRILKAHLTADKDGVKRLKDLVDDSAVSAAVIQNSLRAFVLLEIPDADASSVTRYAREACARGAMGLQLGQRRVVEAVVRESLGESRICEGLPPDELGIAAAAVMLDVAVEHQLTASAIVDIVSRAEQFAIDECRDDHDV